MGNLQVFKYENNDVRTVEMNGEPWFVLKDVCGVLGLSNHKVTTQRLDRDEVSQSYLIDSIGRKQETTVINESGLYNVILRSDKPAAKPFRKWVTAKVLPAIRKKETASNLQLLLDEMRQLHDWIVLNPVTDVTPENYKDWENSFGTLLDSFEILDCN